MCHMPDVPEEVREYFRQLAKKGNYPQKGGKARARKLTAEQRSAIAKQAAAARWKTKPENPIRHPLPVNDPRRRSRKASQHCLASMRLLVAPGGCDALACHSRATEQRRSVASFQSVREFLG
jgi:hypothetical protein